MNVQEMIITEFQQPFVPGKRDCCLAIANVLVQAGFVDYGAKWRRGDHDIRKLPLEEVDQEMQARGLNLIHGAPQALDFGFHRMGAIYCGKFWWGKGDSAAHRLKYPPSAFYRPCHPSS